MKPWSFQNDLKSLGESLLSSSLESIKLFEVDFLDLVDDFELVDFSDSTIFLDLDLLDVELVALGLRDLVLDDLDTVGN